MEKVETLREFYTKKFSPIPGTIQSEFGHFNVFRFAPDAGTTDKSIPYKKRDYFKIALMMSTGRVHLADEVVEVKRHALVFSNPMVKSKWERTEDVQRGFYCVFNPEFLYPYWGANQYPVFQSHGHHVFDLTDEQTSKVADIYERMMTELDSDYMHKYDVLRILVMELVHFVMKTYPSINADPLPANASQRITTLFLGLLERQFPINEHRKTLRLRSPSDFAEHLNVHINHLNRSIKEIMQKTTTQLISERVLFESKLMLKQSSRSVSEIAYALGFNEVARFNNFFKKHTKTSPLKFRHE